MTNNGLNFADWLNEELERRGMRVADLSRAAGLSSGTISNITNGYRRPGPDLCRAIAHTLHLPEEVVFRKAGLLSPKPSDNSKAGYLHGLVDLLDDSELDYVIEIVEWRLSLNKGKNDMEPTDEVGESEAELRARLLEVVEQMSPKQRVDVIKNLLLRARQARANPVKTKSQ